MNGPPTRTVELRRALEALRNGVPNRDAVRELGCEQTAVTDRFKQQLAAVEEEAQSGRQARGMLIAGGYGSGKSHLLEYLKHLALEANFVCSVIVISKETPLYDPAKVYAAAAESAVAPGVTGRTIHEVAHSLDQRSARYVDFFRWANEDSSGISPQFPATLLLHERLNNDLEMLEKVRGFWAGEPLPIAELRMGMRQIGQTSTYSLRTVPAKELPLQRFKFAARLFAAAGYRGWVLLIDEMELIGRYSRLQRGRSYAEFARWMGRVETEQSAGITAVAAIVDDFSQAVLRGRNEDVDKVVPLLQTRNTDEYRAIASRAETAMRLIERESVKLLPPDAAMLDKTYQTLRRIHGQAYGWDPPNLVSAPHGEPIPLTRGMRPYVRRWINEWDLKYFYPDSSLTTVEDELTINYTPTPELEQTSGDPQTQLLDDP